MTRGTRPPDVAPTETGRIELSYERAGSWEPRLESAACFVLIVSLKVAGFVFLTYAAWGCLDRLVYAFSGTARSPRGVQGIELLAVGQGGPPSRSIWSVVSDALLSHSVEILIGLLLLLFADLLVRWLMPRRQSR